LEFADDGALRTLEVPKQIYLAFAAAALISTGVIAVMDPFSILRHSRDIAFCHHMEGVETIYGTHTSQSFDRCMNDLKYDREVLGLD
jgi:hypothetical protein